jgi:arylsulfatase A-like enzyme
VNFALKSLSIEWKRVMKTKKILLIGTGAVLALGPAESLAAQPRPNIVVVLADDAGPGDIGFYHRERTGKKELIPTPNIDRLIAEGMRFDDAHSAASLCAPSRFGMLTGSYSFRNYKPYGVWATWDKTGVDPKFTTSARIAKAAGYATAFFGKSGMGGDYAKTGITETSWAERYKKYDLADRINGPNQWGFDYSIELPSGIQNVPYAFYENGRWMPLKPDSAWKVIGPEQNGYNVSRKHNDWAGIGDSNWDPTLAGPILAEKAQAYIRRQVKKSPEQPFFMYYCTQAVHIPHTPPAELDGVKIKGSTAGPHGDMVRELDVQVGMLVKALKEAGIYDNTLFIFTSDNGGLASDPEAGERGHDPTNGWTGLKGAVHEGGHRVPFIAVWPGRIEAGARSDATVSALDVVATLAAVTGQEISRDQVMDSVDLIPLLTGQPDAKGHAVLVHYSQSGRAALRQGDWKLVVHGKELKNLKPVQLFNLKTNPGEDAEKDLLKNPEYSERAERMLQTLRQCVKQPSAEI